MFNYHLSLQIMINLMYFMFCWSAWAGWGVGDRLLHFNETLQRSHDFTSLF